MKKRTRQVAVVLVAGTACLAAVSFATMRSVASRAGDEASAGHWQSVERRLSSEPVLLRGSLQAASQIIVAAPFDGRIAERFVEWGDAVVQGQRLARLESPELEQQEREAEIALIRSEQELGNAIHVEQGPEYAMASRRLAAARTAAQSARRRAAETQTLFDKGIIARQELDAAQQEVDSADAQSLGAQDELTALRNKQSGQGIRMLELDARNRRAHVDEVRAKRSAAVVVSPISGVVMPATQGEASEAGASVREPRPGAYVTSRDALFTVADTRTLMVKSAVDEADLSRIESCRKAAVNLNSDPTRVVQATVKRVANQPRGTVGMRTSGPESQQFEVEVLVQPPSDDAARFRLGAPATVKIEPCKSAPAVVVPLAALQWAETGEPSIRVRKAGSGDGRLQPVRLQRTGVTDAEVLSGIDAGDEVWIAQAGADKSRPAGILRRLMQSGDDD